MKLPRAGVLLLTLVPAVLRAGPPADKFTLQAAFVPAVKGGNAAVAVTFTPLDPDVHINEEPAPRLKLAEGQTVLVDRQAPPPTRLASADPDHPRYLDLAKPISFPVAIAPGAAKGAQSVPAKVTYFFCSKREGWCRKGSTEISVPLSVP